MPPQGGVPKLQGESKPSLRWSLPSGSLRKSKKVNSLIYKDYTLMEHEDGTKSYVSPEKKAELLVEEKIRKSETKASLENEKVRRKSRRGGGAGGDSDSDSAYETPIGPEDHFSFAKPKSCEDLDKMLSVSASPPQRNSSLSCFEENFRGNSEKINLPPFIKPLETSLTFPIAKQKNKEKKKRESGDSFVGKGESEMNSEFTLPKEEMKKVGNMSVMNENERDEVDGRKIFFGRRSFPVWEKDKKKLKNYKLLETEVKEPITKENSHKPPKQRFSLAWVRNREKPDNLEGETPKSESELTENTKNSPEHEEVDFPKNPKDDHRKSDEDDKITEDKNQPLAETKSSLLQLIDDKMAEDLKEPEEIFLKEEQPKNDNKYGIKAFIPSVGSGKVKNKIENENPETVDSSQPKRYSLGFPLARYPGTLTEPKVRKSRNREKIDPNPLKKMFGIRNVQRMQKDKMEAEKDPQNLSCDEKPNYKETNFDEAEVENVYSSNVSDTGQSPKTERQKLKEPNRFSEPKANVETDTASHRLTFESGNLSLTGEKQLDLDEIPTGRSDTESADHGSADKSSMSKLTTKKQPKKFMSGLLGSFKKGKTKDIVVDADANINPPSLEITVKEQPEEVRMNGTPKSEGIVYAELDMARPGGNLLRRDEGEKTEYAEIIYPSSKMAPERVVDELRKSRENLVSSRENLAEAEEPFATTITPDGKKEAAV